MFVLYTASVINQYLLSKICRDSEEQHIEPMRGAGISLEM